MKTESTPLYRLIASRIREQISPADISEELKMAPTEVIRSLFIAVGEGLITETDVFFVLAKKYKEEISQLQNHANHKRLRYALQQLFPDANIEELQLLASLIRRRVYFAEMYLLLTESERSLHDKIKQVLMWKHGSDETGWWKKGVPDVVRDNCARNRELDGEATNHAYDFTTFIHLKKILEKNWNTFQTHFPKYSKATMQCDLSRLNTLRNQIMHPVRTDMISEADMKFVREMRDFIIKLVISRKK